MGKARMSFSWELLQQSFQIPSTWKLKTAYVETFPFASSEPRQMLHLVIEGENIEDKDPPLELIGIFKQKTIDDQDGRWVQGRWEIFR